jgi:hypothetical protein
MWLFCYELIDATVRHGDICKQALQASPKTDAAGKWEIIFENYFRPNDKRPPRK